ncbi:hypothetical protein [Vibrio harveyi]
MKKSRYSETQIVKILQEVEVGLKMYGRSRSIVLTGNAEFGENCI